MMGVCKSWMEEFRKVNEQGFFWSLFSLVFDMKKLGKANSQEVPKYRILEERWWNKRQNIITAFLDTHFFEIVLVLQSFQHCVWKDSLYDGIYFSTPLKKLLSDLVIYFQSSVPAEGIKIPERLIWQLCLYLIHTHFVTIVSCNT